MVDRYSSLLEDVQESQGVLIDETKAAHGLLINLQNVLLNGEDVGESLEINENSTSQEQVSWYRVASVLSFTIIVIIIVIIIVVIILIL